ncbi:MAG: tRNA lysidine(34) synthetase TilS [Phycisphaerae bacterium]
MNWDGFIEQTAGWLAENRLLEAHQRWVVGVSGGPDSTLLLHAMKAISDRRELRWALHVAHLHHGLRGVDADADAAFVRGLADQMGLPTHLERADIPRIVEDGGGSTEEVARQRRYEFLERVALQAGAESVAIAHHADDNAETILHRIIRGTGMRGLGGMSPIRAVRPASRVLLVRPFLSQRRATIEALCQERGLETRTDASNLSTDYTRGRIRNLVMPMLRKTMNPGVADALLRLGEQARWLGDYLDDTAARAFESLIVSEAPRRIVLNARALNGKQMLTQAAVVRRAITQVLGAEGDLSFAHVEAVLRMAAERASGKELHLPGPLLVRKQYDRLEFCPLGDDHQTPPFAPVIVNSPGATALAPLEAELFTQVCDVDAGKIAELRRVAHPFEEWVDLDRLMPPLVVRGRQEGDRFWPLGAPGSKTLSEFLIEKKVEPAVRARTGLLCDQAGLVWVMPLRIDERVKLRPTSRRALRMTLRGQHFLPNSG